MVGFGGGFGWNYGSARADQYNYGRYGQDIDPSNKVGKLHTALPSVLPDILTMILNLK